MRLFFLPGMFFPLFSCMVLWPVPSRYIYSEGSKFFLLLYNNNSGSSSVFSLSFRPGFKTFAWVHTTSCPLYYLGWTSGDFKETPCIFWKQTQPTHWFIIIWRGFFFRKRGEKTLISLQKFRTTSNKSKVEKNRETKIKTGFLNHHQPTNRRRRLAAQAVVACYTLTHVELNVELVSPAKSFALKFVHDAISSIKNIWINFFF